MSKKIDVFAIDSDVPIPTKARPAREQVPIHQLEVGESILFPSKKRTAVATLASRLKTGEGKVFVINKVDDENHRVWRTE